MNKLYKLSILTISFFRDLNDFGFLIAINNLLWPFLKFLPFPFSRWLITNKNKKITKYLLEHFSDVINNFNIEKEMTMETTSNSIIWFCWLQGEDCMPPVTQICLKSLKRHANNHQVKVITLTNYNKYITIPNYIIQKYAEGKIKNAHFADIIRTCLLYEHGGIWIDSTLFIAQDLPEIIFTTPFYSCKFNSETLYITQCRWSNFFLCAQKGSPIFSFTRNMLFEYIKKEERFIDYFLMDYIIYLGYTKFPEIKREIDQVPLNNENIHTLLHIINEPFQEKKWRELRKNTYLFKLSWKIKYIDSINKYPTYWHHIKQEII